MSEAEGKHRKQVGIISAADYQRFDSAEEKFGVEAKKTVGPSSTMRRASHIWHRRSLDVAMTSLYVAMVVTGHYVTVSELLPRSGEQGSIFRPIYFVVFVLFNLSYCGILYHGPGRPPPPPEPGKAPQLPPAMVAALATGRLCKGRPFGAEANVCSKCETWKPAIVHHCKICAKCSLWMDHHCNFCAQCIGFLNMRCFLVWIFYGYLLVVFLAILTLWRVVWNGLPDHALAWVRGILWCLYMCYLFSLLNNQTIVTGLRIQAGWPSRVLYLRFKGLYLDAQALHKELCEVMAMQPTSDPRFDVLKSAADELNSALEEVTMRRSRLPGKIWGILLANKYLTFSSIFGETPSWRWLLPLIPGGHGDPFQPTVHIEAACNDWVALGAAMEKGNHTLEQHHLGTDEWSQRVQELVKTAAELAVEPWV